MEDLVKSENFIYRQSLNRLKLIKNHVSSKEAVPVIDSLDWCGFDEYLTKDEVEWRKRIRKTLEDKVIPKMDKYLESTEFPFELLEVLQELGICGTVNKGNGCPAMSPMMFAAVYTELFRADGSIAIFFVVQNSLGIDALYLTASDEQIAKLVPEATQFKRTLCFGLTEPGYGSDAASLETYVTKTEGGYLLNGKKRWPGNISHADNMICWARNGKNVEGFLVDLKGKGMKIDKLKGKLSMRAVQNCEIQFDNVFVPEEDRLPKAKDFASGAGTVLKHSRVVFCWAAIGCAAGAYDNCMKYISQRKQFGKTITNFQLSQEKLARMMGHLQGMIHYSAKITKMYFEGKATMGQIALCKAWCSQRGREIVALARELCGGNGIIMEFGVMKAFVDMEVVYTGEGTYDVNALLAGRELTGKSAFR